MNSRHGITPPKLSMCLDESTSFSVSASAQQQQHRHSLYHFHLKLPVSPENKKSRVLTFGELTFSLERNVIINVLLTLIRFY